MRKPWVLDVTLRGDPYALRASVNRIPRARAASRSSASDNARARRRRLRRRPSSTSATSTWACAAANPRMRSRKAVGRPQDRVARHEEPGAREGPGVEAGAVGVGLHETDPRRCGAELRRPRSAHARSTYLRRIRRCRPRSRTCRRRRSVAHASEMCSVGGAVSCSELAVPVPTSQSSPSACPLSLRRRAASTRSMHCREAVLG